MDNKIEAGDARYFCIFKDHELVEKLEEVVEKSETSGEEALGKVVDAV